MLKADFHMHSCEDPIDIPKPNYNAFQLVDEMSKMGYGVIALTLHETIYFPTRLQDYAKKRNILLIPGGEATVDGKHVVVLNPPLNAKLPSTFSELENIREEGAVTIAAHPFFLKSVCLGNKLLEHIEVFDAIEHCYLYSNFLNLNKKAMRIAEEYKKTVVANSDAHSLWQLDRNYTFIDADKKKDDILEAIRTNKVQISTRPFTVFEFSKAVAQVVVDNLQEKLLR